MKEAVWLVTMSSFKACVFFEWVSNHLIPKRLEAPSQGAGDCGEPHAWVLFSPHYFKRNWVSRLCQFSQCLNLDDKIALCGPHKTHPNWAHGSPFGILFAPPGGGEESLGFERKHNGFSVQIPLASVHLLFHNQLHEWLSMNLEQNVYILLF